MVYELGWGHHSVTAQVSRLIPFPVVCTAYVLGDILTLYNFVIRCSVASHSVTSVCLLYLGELAETFYFGVLHTSLGVLVSQHTQQPSRLAWPFWLPLQDFVSVKFPLRDSIFQFSHLDFMLKM